MAFVSIFFLVVFNFFFFLYAAERMFLKGVAYRTKVAVRVVGASVLVLLVMCFDTWLYIQTQNALWSSLILYGSLFGVSILVLWLLFDISWKTALFCGSAGYALQNMGSKFQAVFYHSLPESYLQGPSMYFWLVGSLLVMYLLVFAAAYLIFGKRINGYAREGKADAVSVAISLVTLVIVLLLSKIFDIYTEDGSVLDYATKAVCVICCILILCLLSSISAGSKIKTELDTVQLLWRKKEEEIENFKRNVDIINVKCHDLRHQMRALRNSDQEISRSSLREIEHAISFYDHNINTGNEALDVILTEHSLYCNQIHIRLDCLIDGGKLSFMEITDMYVLFGNAIENAIEAVSKIEEESKRVIRFVGKYAMGLFTVQVENYCAVKPKFKDGIPQTTKAEKDYHGFGMKSMQMVTEKYDGTMQVSCDGTTFLLTLIFPIR